MLGLVAVVEIRVRHDSTSGSAATRADENAALVAEPWEISIFEDSVMLARLEGLLPVPFERGEPIEDAYDLDSTPPKRARSDRDDRIGGRGGTSRKDDTHPPRLSWLISVHPRKCTSNNRCRPGSRRDRAIFAVAGRPLRDPDDRGDRPDR